MDLTTPATFTETNRLKDVFTRIGSVRPIAYTLAGPCTSTPLTYADVPHATWGFDPLAMVHGRPELPSYANGLFVLLAISNVQYDFCARANDFFVVVESKLPQTPICGSFRAASYWCTHDHDKPVTNRLLGMSSTRATSIVGVPKEIVEVVEALPKPVDYPVAKYIKSTEYSWNNNFFEAEESVKEYLGISHADH